MSEAKHTPGRLLSVGAIIEDADGGTVAYITEAAELTPRQKANQRRLVACWNACEGLHTESLERGPALADQIVDALNRAHAAETQRDELLEALEQMVAIHDEPAGFAGKFGKALDAAIEQQKTKIDARLAVARAAIAKATQQPTTTN